MTITVKLTPIVTLTDAASAHIVSKIAERKKGWGIMVGVRTTGCSGLAYVVEYHDLDTPDDAAGDCHVTKHNDVMIVIAKKDQPYLEGMEIDFEKQGLNEGLKFNNPNSKSECGCGESFQV